jgi:hypothetical protein
MDSDGSRGSETIGPIVDNLKAEVALFWNSLVNVRKTVEIEEELSGDIESLNPEKLKVLTKNLSSSRKNLNRKLEAITKEIESNSARLETLKLVGADHDETLRYIEELNEIGQGISQKLHGIDEVLKQCRLKEENLNEEL